MRHRAKLIVGLALAAVLLVAGLSMAAGGKSGGDRHTQRGPMPFRHHGPPPFLGGPAFDADVAAVLGDIHKAVAAKAPEIADPVIQKAQDAGDISSGQADKLRAAAQALADGKDPHEAAQGLDLGDADVRNVIRDALREAAKQAPSIGEPIVAKAESDGKITSKQADEIRKHLKRIASLPRGGPPFFMGPGHPGPPFGDHGRRFFFRGPGHDCHGTGRHGRRQGNQGTERPGAFPGGGGPQSQPVGAPAPPPPPLV